jgi:cyclopropane-fatty-acyl-phospholipid synthase
MTDIERVSTFEMPKGMSFWQNMVCRLANRITVGRITVRFANGNTYVAQGKNHGPSAEITMRNAKPLFRLMTGGDLAFARSYLDGDWDSPDIGALLTLAMRNEEELSSVIASSRFSAWIALLRHRMRSNTKKGSRKNIAYHYDLGNDFYSRWLDETMTYSSALYTQENMELADAQKAKYERIINDLEIGADDHVLEIGCGWGGFAEYAIARTGCRVTGLTLSKEQRRFAIDRLEKAGFGEKADIRLEDYRDCSGTFDKVVSIEMFEAVGEEHWRTYFSTVMNRLKPLGRAMIQVITIDEARFDGYRRNPDFIQTYIFPGGMLPSITAFKEHASTAGLAIRDILRFGTDYARTLMEWDKVFDEKWKEIAPLGFDDRFYRMWRYYLHYCAVGFRSGSIDVAQFHLARS